MRVDFPDLLGINESVLASPVRQIAERSWSADGALVPFTRGKLKGLLFHPEDGSGEVLVVPDPKHVQPGDTRVALLRNLSEPTSNLKAGTWLKHPQHTANPNFQQEIANTLESWRGAFQYVEEDTSRGISGLRRPQIGAVHAVHSDWSISDAVGTVVMPTGTGKTEVMLSILVSAACERLLVIVPTDALRTQLTHKFLSLGILKSAGSNVLLASARTPVVGMLTHIPKERFRRE